MNREELLQKIKAREAEDKEVHHFKQEFKQQELERSIIHEQLEFNPDFYRRTPAHFAPPRKTLTFFVECDSIGSIEW